MATKKRDAYTIDMFTGEVAPVAIPRAKALVVKKPKAEPAPPVPSVPSVPLPPEPTPLVAKPEPVPLPPSPVVERDLTLFPHSYLILLGLAVTLIAVILADNLSDARITSGFIQYRAPSSKPLDQYLLATIRGAAAGLVAFMTICCGVHIAVRPTRLRPLRYGIAALFLVTAIGLVTLAYICEGDYMRMGIQDIARKLHNIRNMKWN